MRLWFVISAVVVVLAAGAAVLISRDEPEVTFCTAEAMIGPTGELFGRSHDHGCQFVDGSGDLVVILANGESLCYDAGALILPCEQPGARRPG